MAMNRSSPSFVALTTIIEEGDVLTLRNYLDSGSSSPNECDEYGQTLLMIASQCGQTAIVNELISQGADVNAEDSDNWSALMNAAKAGHKDIVIKLLDHGAHIEKRDMGSWTPLMWACYKGHFQTVQVLLEHGASLNVHDKFHCTCMIWAAGRGYHDIVKILLDYGAKVNSGDKYGSSPLLWACRKGYTDIVETLLDAGANVDTAGMFSWTPLIVATKGNHAAILNLLLEHKPNVNAVDMDGCTALTTACKEGYSEIAVALMSSGAYINLQDRNNDTNLIHAAKAGHFSIVDALLKKYADVDLHGSEGKTALYWAVEKGYPDIVRLILHANPNIESPTKDGDTALLKATRIRNAEIVQMLVDKKCKVAVTDKKGDTALHIAMRARSKAIIEILLRNPKNSQLLYRANRAGETPYNIDTSHQKSILAQIFGARRLNTNEDSENRLGYDLYSSALADILSEPSLSMPISVGLYAKWGSGKSFLLGKLESEMHNFAIQWMEPTFELSWLVLLVVLLVSITCGLILSIASQKLIVGAVVAAGIFLLTFIFLGAVIYGSRKYYSSKVNRISVILAAQFNAFRTLLFVVFCNPPLKRRNTLNDPVRFIFTEQAKVTSSGNDNSVAQIVLSLLVAIEKEYGFFTTRLYRVFRPKPVQAHQWQWRRMCCIPNFIVTFFVLGIIYGCLALLLVTSVSEMGTYPIHEPSIIRSVLITMAAVVGLILISNIHTWIRLIGSVAISPQQRVLHSLSQVESTQTMNYMMTLKSEVDTVIQMVQCLDAFMGQQSRLVVIVDGLDSCEQEKVLHVLDAVHLLFSDASAPFLTVLAIDPHIIIKAIESNINRVFHNSSISGHEYLRNVVHLPFYLQNSGLRRVKAAQQAALLWNKKSAMYWNEDRECDRTTAAMGSSRKASCSSITENYRKRPSTKGNQKLKTSDSMASSISNLHRAVMGAQDLTKVLLTDDYFSDVNPRSMRRLMNIVYITGRLLKAFNIDFNWYHLASWVNITEQWPYRTSWIIMFYEMHENEIDEMTSLKNIYEKIRGYMPTSKDEDPMLDLDHDERKFEVFLSFHSSNLLVNDLKVFLPFTINLDPYIRKTVQEDHQLASEILKANFKLQQGAIKPESFRWSHSQKSVFSPTRNLDYQNWGQHVKSTVQGSGPSVAPVVLSPPTVTVAPWWNHTDEMLIPYPAAASTSPRPDLSKYSKKLPSGQKLSSLTVDGIISILSLQDKIDKQKMQVYANALKENNISGQVLLTCDLRELKDVLSMSFGDWELFRVLVLALREQEMADLSPGQQVDNLCNQSGLPLSSCHQVPIRSSPSGCDSPDIKKKDNGTSNVTKSRGDAADSRTFTRGRNNNALLEKQITMEESMIVGALETLNEEALEDALEEQLILHRDSNAATASSSAPSNPLSPILSDPEEQNSDEKLDSSHAGNPVANALHSPSELDIMYLRNLRDSPMLHVSALSLSDSITDVETSSAGHAQHFQPILDPRTSPILFTRTTSNAGCSESSSLSSSPRRSHTKEKCKNKNHTQRPSSLISDNISEMCKKETETDLPPIKLKAPQTVKKIQEINKVVSHSSSKGRTTKKRFPHENKKEDSSDSSTETEEAAPVMKSVVISTKVNSPQSEGDGFYSDDEHTPLVSPHHVHRSSHYNLQTAQMHEKEGTPEKLMPKQPHSDPSSCLKSRKPLERQFSIDSYLCERTKPPQTSTSMVKIPESPTHYAESNAFLNNGFPVYGQHVTDTPSPEVKPMITESQSTSNIHNETVV